MPGHPALALPPPPLQRPLLVGYSGGLDSTVLLHLLARDPAHGSPRAIHVHHGLQPAADAWADHCQRTCAALGIGLAVVRVEVARGTGEGLEAAARRARMDAFARALEDGGVLALAHHQDDQAETFLLRALRASGSEGLGAMRPWRRFGRGWLWRPLLDLPRQALVDYARDHGLDWIEDPSNASDVHDRNYLRRRVLPLLRARWPRADAALARAAALQRETTDLLDAGDRQALAAARSVDPACLQATSLAGLPAPRRARVLRRWIAELALPPLPARGLDQVEGWLRDPPSTAAAAFAWHGAELRLWRGLLWAGAAPPPVPEDLRLPWDGRAPLAWPGGGTLSLQPPADGGAARVPGDPGVDGYVVHPRRGGERITLPGRRHSHALKHVLQSLGVPPWIRSRMPLLSDRDGTVLAAGDVAVSARLDAWLRASGRRLRWAGTAPR